MGLFNRSRDKPKSRRNIDPKLNDFIRGVDIDFGVASGVQVDELRAMQTSAVYACVRVLAETVASLPLFLYRNEKDKNTKAREHPLYEVLHDLPNGEMTSFNFREVMMTSLLLYGNAYARIIRDKSGHVKELWYLKPQNMKVERDSNTTKINSLKVINIARKK